MTHGVNFYGFKTSFDTRLKKKVTLTDNSKFSTLSLWVKILALKLQGKTDRIASRLAATKVSIFLGIPWTFFCNTGIKNWNRMVGLGWKEGRLEASSRRHGIPWISIPVLRRDACFLPRRLRYGAPLSMEAREGLMGQGSGEDLWSWKGVLFFLEAGEDN